MTITEARRAVAPVTLVFICLYCVKPMFLEPGNDDELSEEMCVTMWEIAQQIDSES